MSRRKHTPDLPNACPICSPARCTKASGRGTIRTKRVVGVIDCTPTWRGLLPLMIQIMREAGHPETENMWRELNRMALRPRTTTTV